MELVTNLPKPEGFFDPKAPAGEPTAPERRRTVSPEAEAKAPARQSASRRIPRSRRRGPTR